MKLLVGSILMILTLLALWSCGSKSDSASCPAGTGVVSISVSPANPTLTASQITQQFTAVAKDFNNQPVCGIKFFWTDTGNVSCIDQNGLATISNKISTFTPDTITASSGSFSGTTTLTYSGPPLLPNQGC